MSSSLWANPLSGVSVTSSEASHHEMVVKFKSNSTPEVNSNKITFPQTNQPVTSLKNELSSLHYTPLFDQKAKPTAAGSSKDLSSLSGMMTVDISQLNLEEMKQLCIDFEKLNEVEYCSLSPIFSPFGNTSESDIPVITPPRSNVSDLYSYQKYFHNSYEHSINAEFAWDLGLSGKNVTLRDAEWAIDVLHEDFVGADLTTGLAQTKDDYSNHGTAVMGVLISQDNGWGTRGSVPDAKASFYSENTGRTTAIAKMVQDASAGDILILEMQTNGCDSKLSTPDYPSAVWDLVKSATDNDILVVMAAGNGASNLDAACYSSYTARGDNGGIIVGAGNGSTRGKMSFSTYGSAVDLMGWGGSVTTLDYGDAYNGGTHAKYTHTFNGTSSATPVVASAMALVQDFAKEKMGRFLKPKEMRTLLISTGQPQLQNLSTPIGPLPDVKAAIEKLAADNGITLVAGSSTALSSGANSSVALSSSLAQSSAQLQSSSANAINCDVVDAWEDRSYNWSATLEYVVFNNKLYSHTDWVDAQPDASSTWKLEGDCPIVTSSEAQSSAALSSVQSSSSEILSSSEVITAVYTNNAVQISETNSTQISFDNTLNTSFKLYNSQGVKLEEGLIQGESLTWNKPLSQGVYFINIQNKISSFTIH